MLDIWMITDVEELICFIHHGRQFVIAEMSSLEVELLE